MLEKFLPEQIDPFRYADQSLLLEGKVKIADMKRLIGALMDTGGEVCASLDFGIDEQGLTYLKGSLQGELCLQCQRCMEAMKYELSSNFALGIVNTLEESKSLPEHYEPALAVDGFLSLRELIEDEVILNLPIIPRHDQDACPISLPLEQEDEQKSKDESPFQVLKSLKTQEQV